MDPAQNDLHSMKPLPFIVGLAGMLLVCASGAAPVQRNHDASQKPLSLASFFPFEPGMIRIIRLAGSTSSEKVLKRDAGTATVLFAFYKRERELTYTLRSDAIIDSDGRTVILKTPLEAGTEWQRNEAIKCRIEETGVAVRRPEGEYRNCIVVWNLNKHNPERTPFYETFCPGVGFIQSEEEKRGGRIFKQLISFE